MKKIIKESQMSSANFAKYAEAAELIFSLNWFVSNWKSIVKDFGYVGSCVLQDWKNNKLYGLMFKDQGGDENGNFYLKCHIYSYPQNDLIRGGNTFFVTISDKFDFKSAIEDAISKVR
jgi:hypothetical protein